MQQSTMYVAMLPLELEVVPFHKTLYNFLEYMHRSFRLVQVLLFLQHTVFLKFVLHISEREGLGLKIIGMFSQPEHRQLLSVPSHA